MPAQNARQRLIRAQYSIKNSALTYLFLSIMVPGQ
jgi:hypothetical protein